MKALFQARMQQTRRALEERYYSAALLRLPENVVLFSGYWPRNGFSFIWIPVEGTAALIVPHGDEHEARAGFIDDVRPFGWVRLKDGNPYERISGILSSLQARDGIPAGAKIMVDNDFNNVAPPLCSGETSLPGRTTMRMIKDTFQTEFLMPAEEIVQDIRIIKNDWDLLKLQLANVVAKQGLDRFQEMIQTPGMSEIEIAAEVESFIAKAAAQAGAIYGKAWAQVSSGNKTADAYLPGMISSSRRIASGDMVMIEMGIVVDGYWSDLTRTAAAGSPDSRQSEILRIVYGAQRAGIQAVRDGVAAQDVDSAARRVIDEAGLGEYFVHHTGHGLGFSYHESAPYIGPGSNTVLRAGMVHSVEPGIYIPGWGGVRIEDNVFVTVDGCVILGDE